MPVDACFVSVAADNSKFILAGFSISLSLAAFGMLKFMQLSNKAKIGLIYLHLFGLFFPVALFSTNAACGFLCLPCFEGSLSLAVLALPSAFILTTIAGFVIIPLYFLTSSRHIEIKDSQIRNFTMRHSKRLNIMPPKIYAVDSPKPFAFSFRSFSSAIILSVGMMDILRKKELEAVLLHELAHLQHKASAFKLSTFLMRFSPFWVFKTFNQELDMEEEMADRFARQVQGSGMHLFSAKRKVSSFSKLSAENEKLILLNRYISKKQYIKKE